MSTKEFKLGLGDEHLDAVPDHLVAKEERKFRVVIEQGDEQELNYVAISVNGNAFQIMRGAEVILPESYLEALNNAVGTRLSREYSETERKLVMVPRQFNRYPYRVLGEVTPKVAQQAPQFTAGSMGDV